MGKRVADNVARVRRDRDLRLREVSAELAEIGRPIGIGQLSKLEAGQRRVDVDDLVALAMVLDVTPAQLLMPTPYEPEAEVPLTPIASTTQFRAWQWLCGDLWLDSQERPPTDEAEGDWFEASRPHDMTGVYNFNPKAMRGQEPAVRRVIEAAQAAIKAGMTRRQVLGALDWFLAVSPAASLGGAEATRG